jgi:hypothetical protein
MVHNGTLQQLRQRVTVNPGATYTVSGWLKTQGLVPTWVTLTANVLDGSGATIATVPVGTTRGNSPYAYHQATLVAPPQAVYIELVGELSGAGSGLAFFDDLRIRDRNRLRNGGFEQTPAVGRFVEGRPVDWGGRGGDVFTTPVHGGKRAAGLVPAGNTHLLSQLFEHTPGSRYRISAWIRTDGETLPARLTVFFKNAQQGTLTSASVASIVSEGAYTFVSTDIASFPTGTAGLDLVFQYGERPASTPITGHIYIDDVLVEAY